MCFRLLTLIALTLMLLVELTKLIVKNYPSALTCELALRNGEGTVPYTPNDNIIY